MNKKFLLIVTSLLFLSNPLTTFAQEQESEQQNSQQEPTEIEQITKDTYLIAEENEYIFNTPTTDDLYVIGTNVKLTTPQIQGDVGILATDIKIGNGVEILGDTRLLGNSIFINGTIKDDVFIAGTNVEFGKETVIEGNVQIFADSLTLLGDIQKDVHITSNSVKNGARILGNAEITAYNTLTTQENALINGDAKILSTNQIRIPEENTNGTITYEQISPSNYTLSFNKSDIFKHGYEIYLSVLIAFLIATIFAGAVVMPILRKPVLTISENALDHVGRNLLIGGITIIGIPFIASIFFATAIGIPITVFLLCTLFCLLFFSKVFMGILIGRKIIPLDHTSTTLHSIGSLTTGTIIVGIFSLIPNLGTIFEFLLMNVFLGATIHQLYTNLFTNNAK